VFLVKLRNLILLIEISSLPISFFLKLVNVKYQILGSLECRKVKSIMIMQDHQTLCLL